MHQNRKGNPPRVCKQYPEEFNWQKQKTAHPCGESPSSSNEIQFRDRMQMDADCLRQITAHSSYATINPTHKQQSQNNSLHSSDSTSFSNVIDSASKKNNNPQVSSHFSPQHSSSGCSLSTSGCDTFFFNQYRGGAASNCKQSNNAICSPPTQFANFSAESRQPFNSNMFTQLRQQQSLNKHHVKIKQKTDNSPARNTFNFTEDEVNQMLQQDSISLGHTRLEAQEQSQILQKQEKLVVGESQQRSANEEKRQNFMNEVQQQRHNSLAKFTSASQIPQSDISKMNQQLASFSANSYQQPMNGIFTRFSSQQSSVDRTTTISYPSFNHPSFFKATADGSNSLRPMIPRICSKQRLHTMSLVQSTSASRLGSPNGINRSKNISIDFPTICADSITDLVKESIENSMTTHHNNNLHLLREPRPFDRDPPQNVLKLPIIYRDNSLSDTKTLTNSHHRHRSTQLFSIPQSIIKAIVAVPIFSKLSSSASTHQPLQQQQPYLLQPSRSLDEEEKTETQQESPHPLPLRPHRDIKTPSFNTRASQLGTYKQGSESANQKAMLSEEMNSSFGVDRLKQLPSLSFLNQRYKGETATLKGSFNTSRIAEVARNQRVISKHKDEPVFVPFQLKDKPILSAVPTTKEFRICMHRRISLSTQVSCAKESKPTKVAKDKTTLSNSPAVGTPLNLSKITSYRQASLNSSQRRRNKTETSQQIELSIDGMDCYKESQLNQVNSLAS